MRGAQQPGRRRFGEHRGQLPLRRQVHRRRHAAEMPCFTCAHAEPPNSAEVRPSSKMVSPSAAKPMVSRAAHPGAPRARRPRGRQDGGGGGLVVEAHIAAGHRHPEGGARVREPAYRLGELPHDRGIFRGPEVEAVGDGERDRAGGGHVPVGLGQRELRPRVGVEPGVAAVAVGGERHTQVRPLVDPDRPGILRHGEHGVTPHVPVVLLGDPGFVGQARRGEQGHQRGAQLSAGEGRGSARRVAGRQLVLIGRARRRAPVHRAIVGRAARRDVDDLLAVPGHLRAGRRRSLQPITVAGTSHLAQISRKRPTSPGSTMAIMRSCDSLIKI